MPRLAAVVAVSAGCLAAAETSRAGGLSPADEKAIRGVVEAYRDGWLAGDPEAVMRTLTPDAVLLPSGQTALEGQAAIRAFWWPPNAPPTKVLEMELNLDDVGGEGGLAYARGFGTLTFRYEEDGAPRTRSQASTFLNVLKRQPDGSWRVALRMWSNLPER